MVLYLNLLYIEITSGGFQICGIDDWPQLDERIIAFPIQKLLHAQDISLLKCLICIWR